MSVSLQTRPPKVRTRAGSSLFEPSIVRRALGEAFVKLDPRTMIRNPVMFTVEIGSVVTTVEFIGRPDLFVGLVTLWLWATVLFANFAEAVAEGRGKAQADTLRRSRKETFAHLLQPDGTTQEIPSAELRAGNLAVVTACQVIPGDGDVVEGMAVVDESAKWTLTQPAPQAVLMSALSTGQSAMASEPSFIASVSRLGEATDPESRWSRPITIGAFNSPRATISLKASPSRCRSPRPTQQIRAGRPWKAMRSRAMSSQ
jgi:hypothetical protein